MDIKVNKAEWDGLQQDVRTKIQSIIGNQLKGATIVADAAAPSAGDKIKEARPPFNLKNPFCEAACNIAEAGAVAACSALSGGTAIAVCIVAAHEAGNACRSSC